MNIHLPVFESDSEELNLAWRIAMGDILGNIRPYHAGLLEKSEPCLVAGLDYSTPWTRDTAINTCFAMSWLCPEVAKNSLLSVCVVKNGQRGISGWGQDWDAAIWGIGAYQYLQVTRDHSFLPVAQEVIRNTLAEYENSSFDESCGLFEGPAVYGDGIAAYPDRFTTGTSGIVDCKETMFSLSTNCMFYMVYRIAEKLCGGDYGKKADKLKEAVNRHFWNESRGSYDYLAHECEYQEGLGISFALLSGIADEERAENVIRSAEITPNGIACVFPSFERYTKLGGLGRHSGTVWPFIQGFWGLTLDKYQKTSAFDENLRLMAEKACRDGQFSEIYHSVTGEIYGGLQEDAPDGKIREWKSLRRQTWSATAFLALIVYGLFGCRWNDGILQYEPRLPEGCGRMRIEGLPDADGKTDIAIGNWL